MTTLNGLYSKQVYWPETVQAVITHVLSCRHIIQPTVHAQVRMAQLYLPDNVYKIVIHGKVIEAEFNNGRLIKIVTRMPHKSKPLDICAAISIEENVCKVKTIWLNNYNDNHNTISKEAYVNG